MTLDFHISNQFPVSLYNHKLVHYYDPLSNYSIVESVEDYIRVSDVADFQFWTEFSVPLDMKMVTIALNSTNWIFYEKLSNLDKTMVNIELSWIVKIKTIQLIFLLWLQNTQFWVIWIFIKIQQKNILEDL
uniref:Uncharacterized protein n=1 Tax=Panagrolaimus sp. JU765 TaxID=591449 RepID=A0AC34RL90_9BILA